MLTQNEIFACPKYAEWQKEEKNMSSKDTSIILASVGTTIIRAKVTTYDMIKRDLADYSGMEVLQVFTDDNAAHAMSEPEDRVYTVEEALEKAIALGYSKVIAVPVFMTKGELYNSLKSRLDFYLDRLEITMTDSVLHDAQSCREFRRCRRAGHTLSYFPAGVPYALPVLS